jgi:hypothetical protein
MTNSADAEKQPGFIPSHGGYETLKSYQMSVLVYDATVKFCDRFIDPKSRTHDQMVQAARSGNKNIVEGSRVSGTTKKMELKLTGVARASLEGLLGDYKDFLRQRGLAEWGKNHPMAGMVRRLAYAKDRSYQTTARNFLKAGRLTRKTTGIIRRPDVAPTELGLFVLTRLYKYSAPDGAEPKRLRALPSCLTSRFKPKLRNNASKAGLTQTAMPWMHCATRFVAPWNATLRRGNRPKSPASRHHSQP